MSRRGWGLSLGLRTWAIWGTITHGTKPAEAWGWVVESYESPQQLGVILPNPHPNVSSLTLPPPSIGSRHACLWTSYLSA